MTQEHPLKEAIKLHTEGYRTFSTKEGQFSWRTCIEHKDTQKVTTVSPKVMKLLRNLESEDVKQSYLKRYKNALTRQL